MIRKSSPLCDKIVRHALALERGGLRHTTPSWQFDLEKRTSGQGAALWECMKFAML